MSGFAVLVDWENPRPDSGAVQSMLDAMSHRGPDGMTVRATEHCVLGHALMSVHPRDRAVSLPHYDARRRWWITGDIRIDNRDDVARALGIKVPPPDALLVLEAYEKWGDDCPDKLYGDFAFAIWDERERRLFAARDALGSRPLFHCTVGSRLLLASEVDALLASADVSRAVNAPRIADWLLGSWPAARESFFVDVATLPAGYVLRATARARSAGAFYRFPSVECSTRSELEDAQEFRRLALAAVAARVETDRPVVCELSGGLDSASVASLAGALVREGHFSRNQIALSSLVFPGRALDEQRYSSAVAHAHQLDHYLVDWTRLPFRWPVVERLQNPELNWAYWPISRLWAARADARVVLTGLGGDELTMEFATIYDVAAARHVRAVPGILRNRLAYGAHTRAVRARTLIAASIPAWAKRGARFARGRLGLRDAADAANVWWGPELVARAQQPASDFGAVDRVPADVSNLQRATWRAVMSPLSVYVREMREREGALLGRELRHPLLDRALFEFVLSVPWQRRVLRGTSRRILREALGQDLPSLVRGRVSKLALNALRDASALNVLGNLQYGIQRDARPLLDYVTHEWVERLARIEQQQVSTSQEECSKVWRLAALQRWLCLVSQGYIDERI